MGLKTAIDKTVEADIVTGEGSIRSEIFKPEQAKHSSGSANYLNEDDAYTPRRNSSENPF